MAGSQINIGYVKLSLVFTECLVQLSHDLLSRADIQVAKLTTGRTVWHGATSLSCPPPRPAWRRKRRVTSATKIEQDRNATNIE